MLFVRHKNAQDIDSALCLCLLRWNINRLEYLEESNINKGPVNCTRYQLSEKP